MASKNGRTASCANTNSSGGSVSSLGSCDMNSAGQLQPKQQHHLLTTGTITVTTSTPNTQRLRSHTTSDVNFYSSTETPTSCSGGGLLRSTTTAAASSSSGGGHLWNVDLTDLSYLTHMQRVRARASFARQMSNTSSERSRRRESIAAVNFPVHLTSSGTGLNFLGASKWHDYFLVLYPVYCTLIDLWTAVRSGKFNLLTEKAAGQLLHRFRFSAFYIILHVL